MKKILVAGPVLTRSGYGEMARFALRSLKSRTDVDLHVMPTTWGNTGWMLGESEELNWINSLIAHAKTGVCAYALSNDRASTIGSDFDEIGR